MNAAGVIYLALVAALITAAAVCLAGAIAVPIVIHRANQLNQQHIGATPIGAARKARRQPRAAVVPSYRAAVVSPPQALPGPQAATPRPAARRELTEGSRS